MDGESERPGPGQEVGHDGAGEGLGEWSILPNPPINVNVESNQEPDPEVLSISVSSDENDVFLSFSEKYSEDDGTKLSLSQVSSVDDPEGYVGNNAHADKREDDDDRHSLYDVSDDEGIYEEGEVAAVPRASVSSALSGCSDISLIEPDVDVTMVTASLIDEVSGCDVQLDDANGNIIPPEDDRNNSTSAKDIACCDNEDLDLLDSGKSELENIVSNQVQEQQNSDALVSSQLPVVGDGDGKNGATNLGPGIGKEEIIGEELCRLAAANENDNQKNSELKAAEDLRPTAVTAGCANVDAKQEEQLEQDRKKLSPIKWKKTPTKPVDSELAQSVLDKIVNRARFFLIKSCNYENVAISKSENIWATGEDTGFKLRRALSKSDNVILFFSVNVSQKFCGFARVVRETTPETYKAIKWVGKGNEFPNCFELDWISRCDLEFFRTQFLRNRFNFHKPVKVGRDGQEIDSKSGAMLASLFAIDATTDWKKVAEGLKSPGASSSQKQHLEDAVTDSPNTSRSQGSNSGSSGNRVKDVPAAPSLQAQALATSTPVRIPARLTERGFSSLRKRPLDADSGRSPTYKRSRNQYQYDEGPYSWKDVCAWGSQHTWHRVPPAPPMPFPPPPPFDVLPPPPGYWPPNNFAPSHVMYGYGQYGQYGARGGPYY